MVGLGPGNIVLDMDPAPPPRGTAPQILAHVCCGWMDQAATQHEGRPQPRPHCVTWGPSSPSTAAQPLLKFRPTLPYELLMSEK